MNESREEIAKRIDKITSLNIASCEIENMLVNYILAKIRDARVEVAREALQAIMGGNSELIDVFRHKYGKLSKNNESE